MDEEMKDFVGYHKTRTPPAIPIAMLPAWANTVERSVLLLNTSIVIFINFIFLGEKDQIPDGLY